jgi:hypothetical protein
MDTGAEAVQVGQEEVSSTCRNTAAQSVELDEITLNHHAAARVHFRYQRSSLPTTTTHIHPFLRLCLYNLNLLINQLHQRCTCGLLPQHLISNLQQQFIDVELDCTGTDAPLHDLGGEVIRAVQSDQNALVDLLVYSFEAVEVDLAVFGPARAVVAVNVPDRRREDIDAGSDEGVDVGWRGEEGCECQ